MLLKILQKKSSIIKTTKIVRRMQKIYANFNPDEWQSVDSSDPNIYQYIADSSFGEEYIYIKYDDGRYRYIQPISLGVSKGGNYHLFCYKDDGQKRKYSLNKIQNFLFKLDFINDYLDENNQNEEELVQDIMQENTQDDLQNPQIQQDEQDVELPFDNHLETLQNGVEVEDYREEENQESTLVDVR